MCSEWLTKWSPENGETDLTGVHGRRQVPNSMGFTRAPPPSCLLVWCPNGTGSGGGSRLSLAGRGSELL